MSNLKKKIKQKMLKEKEEELVRYEILEEYLKERINQGETQRRNDLIRIQKLLEEIRKLIEFFKK